jgi:hypothetical protein
MILDCMTCPVRGQRCDDCVVTALCAPRPAEHLATAELRASTGRAPSVELSLDAAEHKVVSMFVGAGLVKAEAVARLHARPESGQGWASVRDVG